MAFLNRKKVRLEQETQECDGLGIGRWTYDEWIKRHPSSDRGEYARVVRPRDYLGCCGMLLTQCVRGMGVVPAPDTPIMAALIDGRYEEWLAANGDVEDGAEAMVRYVSGIAGPEEGRRVEEAGLAITDRLYALPVFVVSEPGSMDTVMSAETAGAVAGYMESVIGSGNFHVCCLPVLAGPETFLDMQDSILAMAGECMDGMKIKSYGKLGHTVFEDYGGPLATMLFMPILVREVHPGARVTVSDVLAAAVPEAAAMECPDGGFTPEFLGRHPYLTCWDEEGLALAGRQDVTAFEESEAGRLLDSQLQGMFTEYPYEVTARPIRPEDIPDVYEGYVKMMKKEIRRASRKGWFGRKEGK